MIDVQQVVLDVQITVQEVSHGVVVVLDVMAVQGNAGTLVLPVPVVAGDALVALAVPVDVGQPATAGAHNHAHQAAATRRGLEV